MYWFLSFLWYKPLWKVSVTKMSGMIRTSSSPDQSINQSINWRCIKWIEMYLHSMVKSRERQEFIWNKGKRVNFRNKHKHCTIEKVSVTISSFYFIIQWTFIIFHVSSSPWQTHTMLTYIYVFHIQNTNFILWLIYY